MRISTAGRALATARRLGLLLLLSLFFAPATHAQIAALIVAAADAKHASNIQFVTKGNGSYQLTDGTWQRNYLFLTQRGMEVGKGKKAKYVGPDVLQQVVISIDTFAVVHKVHFPADKNQVPSPALDVVARRNWRCPQVELLDYSTTFGNPMPLLRFPDGRAVVLPRDPKGFRAAMLLLVGDQPNLADQLRTNELDASHARQILTVYLRWKPTGFDPTALLAATPAAN